MLICYLKISVIWDVPINCIGVALTWSSIELFLFMLSNFGLYPRNCEWYIVRLFVMLYSSKNTDYFILFLEVNKLAEFTLQMFSFVVGIIWNLKIVLLGLAWLFSFCPTYMQFEDHPEIRVEFIHRFYGCGIPFAGISHLSLSGCYGCSKLCLLDLHASKTGFLFFFSQFKCPAWYRLENDL